MPRPGRGGWAAGLLLVGLVLLWGAAYHDVSSAREDARAYFAYLALGESHARLAQVTSILVAIGHSGIFALLASMPVAVALLRRRGLRACVLAAMMVAAVLTSEVLKPALNAHRPAVGLPATALTGVGSWPSGHMTAATIIALAWLLACPATWRAFVAGLGTLLSLGVGASVMMRGSHYPSDVIGGVLVAALWALGAVGVLRAREGPGAGRFREGAGLGASLLLTGACACGAALLVLIILLAIPGPGGTPALEGQHHALLLTAVILAAIAGLAPTLVLWTLSGSGRAARAARRDRWPRG